MAVTHRFFSTRRKLLKFTRFDPRSIKVRVTFSTLSIFVASLLVLLFLTSRMLQNDMQRLLSEQQFSTVSFMAAEINDELTKRLRVLTAVAARITPAMIGNPAALQFYLEERLIIVEEFNAGAIAFNTEGTVIADSILSSGRRGGNHADIAHIRAALREGRSMVGIPHLNQTQSRPEFGMAVPIRDAQGQVIGALAGVTDLGKPHFLDNLTQTSYGKTGGYLLVAPQSRLIVTATDKRRIMEILPAPGINPLIDRFIQGYEGSGVTVSPLGVEVLASAKGVPVAGWYVVVALPTAEAFALIHAMQQRMVWITILLTLLAGGLTWWMLKRQFVPMLATVNTLARLSESTESPQALPITRQDEIGELIGGFNRLLETLRRRDEALRRSENKFRMLFELSPVGMALVDHGTGNFLEVNEAVLRPTGYTQAEFLKLSYWEITPQEYEAQELQQIRDLNETGHFGPNEKEYIRKDGSRFPIAISGAMFGAVNEQPVVWGVIEDITKRKEAEHALQQQTDALARSNAELEQFAYVASHDLRQPLRMVNSYVQMLERRLADRLDDDTREMMHFVVDGAKRMDQMLVSLIEYSRVGRKGEPLALLSSRTGVDEALRFLAPAIREANATVRVSGDWPDVVASRDEFTRLWQNLIGNAVKYRTPDRAPDIAITVTPDANNWRFCVADNGIGIAPAQFDRLFKVFQRLVTRNQYEGTGIGLAVARKIVERHGGQLWVESAGAGQGCRFCFSLPIARTS
jgi:PAS domain S-box-containing protein